MSEFAGQLLSNTKKASKVKSPKKKMEQLLSTLGISQSLEIFVNAFVKMPPFPSHQEETQKDDFFYAESPSTEDLTMKCKKEFCWPT